MKLTWAHVTYKHDLALSRRQLLSMYKYMDPNSVHEIILVWNDTTDTVDFMLKMLEATRDERFQVRYVTAKDLIGKDPWFYGWWGQQHLKMQVAREVTTDWFILTDAKDQMVAPATANNFIDGNGRTLMTHGAGPRHAEPDAWVTPPRTNDPKVHHRFKQCYGHAYDLMGLDVNDYDRILRCDWISTVWTAHTETNQDLIEDLESRFNRMYHNLFNLETMGGHWRYFTEYALISAWYEHQGKMDLFRPYQPSVRGGLFPCMAQWDKDLRGLPWHAVKDLKENKNENTDPR